jgi:hypothetical protein
MAQCHRAVYPFPWHTMSQPEAPYISMAEAVPVFGISKRTIERAIKSGEIGRDQIRYEGGKRLFLVAELVRVF